MKYRYYLIYNTTFKIHSIYRSTGHITQLFIRDKWTFTTIIPSTLVEDGATQINEIDLILHGVTNYE